MKLRIAGAALNFMTLVAASGSALAQEAAKMPTLPESRAIAAEALPELAPTSPFVPANFDVPALIETDGFKLVPLGPDVVKADFEAYMSSIEHLQKTFSRSTQWPRQDISQADAMQDMQNEQARFKSRKSFAYAVLTPDGSRERGSVYVSPSTVEGYDAVVRMWVTKADYDAGFDAELYQWVTRWIAAEWPFKKVAYPGRAIDWKTWDALVAAGSH